MRNRSINKKTSHVGTSSLLGIVSEIVIDKKSIDGEISHGKIDG